ncbi:trypsin-like serine peptidase [Staphylococcus intermedius]|uniref:Serine protease n=1 Tax=Staphylococcus intermedius NCTC 11048 TaxID=1141106 RepID=A0A380G4Z4_STAIN|nr:serine protease [Staphylococcus intermedius]PCF63884.1 serine protease [Staphylococcus intermedius]PCF78599.1 serine protease [Staphylococcus intermedius]PCF79572.1 serine protease [Staphylococcus intermedius]PCF86693.1 serine protease [Staphylococcus intermedius]PCF89770.1 serine protease [Staphylococcus intermedius]
MKKKVLMVLGVCVLMTMFTLSNVNAKDNPTPGTQVVVNTTTDPNGRLNGRYDPENGLYCSAVLITPNMWLTARHCAGSKAQKGYIGQVYPGQSGWSTPFGMMIIREYDPDAADDIAIIKGTDRDKTAAYKHYIKSYNTMIYAYNPTDLPKLKGEKIYSYGYPGGKGGFKQYKSTGTITDYNRVTHELSTTMPAEGGQSGSGAFLDNGHFLGIVYATENKMGYLTAKIHPINERLKKWIDDNKSK